MLESVFTQLRQIAETQIRNGDNLSDLRRELLEHRMPLPLTENHHQGMPSISVSPRTLPASSSPCIGQQECPGPITIQVRQMRRISCSRSCSCTCHSRRYLRSPRIFDHILGSLFLGYSSIPVFTPKCNTISCSRYSHSAITVTFICPCWLLHRLLWIAVVNTRRDGPELNIRTARMRSDTDTIFYYAFTGNIDAIKCLFAIGHASPFDTSTRNGMSVLSVNYSYSTKVI